MDNENECLYSEGFGGDTCDDIFNCCDCGDENEGCGCAYCWSCNACENCLEEED